MFTGGMTSSSSLAWTHWNVDLWKRSFPVWYCGVFRWAYGYISSFILPVQKGYVSAPASRRDLCQVRCLPGTVMWFRQNTLTCCSSHSHTMLLEAAKRECYILATVFSTRVSPGWTGRGLHRLGLAPLKLTDAGPFKKNSGPTPVP
jgi:hypothetical protein